jgi:hypothetical protein
MVLGLVGLVFFNAKQQRHGILFVLWSVTFEGVPLTLRWGTHCSVLRFPPRG